MTDSGNGRVHPDDEGPDDDAPLGPEEAVAAAAEATAETDEALDERVEAVIEELDGVTRRREDELVTFEAGGRLFAVLMVDLLEVLLDRAVADAALRTPDTMASNRGSGWIAFHPEDHDRFALDRAEAWVRSAHRRATAP